MGFAHPFVHLPQGNITLKSGEQTSEHRQKSGSELPVWVSIGSQYIPFQYFLDLPQCGAPQFKDDL